MTLRPRTLAALAAARDAGIRTILVTGRMVRSVRPYALAAGIADPVVCYQGAAVVDPATGQLLLHEPIPLELALEAIAALEGEGFPVNCYVDDELYVAEVTPEAARYAAFQNLPIHAVGDLRSWLAAPATKLVTGGEPAALDALGARMRERFADRLHVSKSLPIFLELSRKGITKGSGLEFLAKRLGFALERTVAFGDGENDVELLEQAGYGVAVRGAHERLLALADLVCPPAEEEGVAQVIEAVLAARTGARPDVDG